MSTVHLTGFRWARMLAVFIKEFQQMMRDRLTFGMAVGVPILQLGLFGYAINTDPKGLPTAIVCTDSGPMARGVLAAMVSSSRRREMISTISFCDSPPDMVISWVEAAPVISAA